MVATFQIVASLDRTEMAICPHCRGNTIGVHAKSWSSAAHPTKCKQCGGLSYIANTNGTAWGRATGLLPFVAVAVLLVTGSLWVIAAAFAAFLGIVAYEAFVFYRLPMLPASASSVVEARHWQRVGLLIIGATVVIIGAAVMVHRAV